MKVSFEGIGEVMATFLAQEGVAPGMAVTLAEDSTVGLGESGGDLCGVAVTVGEDGCAGVRIGGLVETAYSGTAPQVGYDALTVDGAGKVTAGGSRAYLVVHVDQDAQTAVIRL